MKLFLAERPTTFTAQIKSMHVNLKLSANLNRTRTKTLTSLSEQYTTTKKKGIKQPPNQRPHTWLFSFLNHRHTQWRPCKDFCTYRISPSAGPPIFFLPLSLKICTSNFSQHPLRWERNSSFLVCVFLCTFFSSMTSTHLACAVAHHPFSFSLPFLFLFLLALLYLSLPPALNITHT